jgi:hypothetical protein
VFATDSDVAGADRFSAMSLVTLAMRHRTTVVIHQDSVFKWGKKIVCAFNKFSKQK